MHRQTPAQPSDSRPVDRRNDAPGHSPDAAFDQLLDLGAALGPEYGAGLSSPLPMALSALRALGANPARLRQFFDGYAGRFSGGTEGESDPVPAGGWLALRGRYAAFASLAAHFGAELQRRGPDATLRACLPALMPGVAAAAFHGLIRTAYAADASRPAELASALAYWACRWLPLSPRMPDPLSADFGETPRGFEAWSQQLLASETQPRPPGRMIVDRVGAVLRQESYARLAGRLAVEPDTLAMLAALAVDRYNASRNFTVLHLVTGCHAMRMLLPWLEGPEAALGHFANAFAAAYLACGIEPGASTLASAGLEWPEIIARAIRSDDDHVIKLVHTCRAEAAVYGDAVYRHAAGLVVA